MRFVLAVVGIVAAFATVLRTPSEVIDLRADWLTAQAISDGLNPHQPPTRYEAAYGVTSTVAIDEGNEGYHPRTPGALLLSMPLALLSLDSLPVIGLMLLVVEAAAASWLVARLLGAAEWKLLAMLPVYFVSMIGVGLTVTGGRSMLVLACIAGGLVAGQKGDSLWAGAPLGVAVTLKMWPWALPAVLFLAGRRKMALGAGGSFLVLNGVGLLLPAVSATSSLEALAGGSGWVSYGDNGSLASILGDIGVGSTAAVIASQVALLAVLVWLSRFGWYAAAVAAIPFAVFFAPLAWPQYLTSVLLALLWSGRRGVKTVWLAVPPLFAWMFGISVGPTVSVVLSVAAASVVLALYQDPFCPSSVQIGTRYDHLVRAASRA